MDEPDSTTDEKIPSKVHKKSSGSENSSNSERSSVSSRSSFSTENDETKSDSSENVESQSRESPQQSGSVVDIIAEQPVIPNPNEEDINSAHSSPIPLNEYGFPLTPGNSIVPGEYSPNYEDKLVSSSSPLSSPKGFTIELDAAGNPRTPGSELDLSHLERPSDPVNEDPTYFSGDSNKGSPSPTRSEHEEAVAD